MANLTELGIFISSLLLSVAGCFAVVASHLRKSNCTEIGCCGVACKRQNMHIADDV